MEVEPDAIAIVVLGGVACEILGLNSYSNAGFNLVSAKAYDDNLEAIGSGVLQHEAGLGPFELISSDVIYETLSAPCQTQAGCWMVVQYCCSSYQQNVVGHFLSAAPIFYLIDK